MISLLNVNTANNSRPRRDGQESKREIERERDWTEREIARKGENWRTRDLEELIDGGSLL